MTNTYIEIIITIQPISNVAVRNIQESLATYFNSAMLADTHLKELHHQNKFKNYVFSSPYPLEKDKVYHSDRLYVVNFRTPDPLLAAAMRAVLPYAQGDFKLISSEVRNYEHRSVEKIVTLSPTICTVSQNHCWLQEDGLSLLSDRIHSNTVKKAKALDPTFAEPPEYFFERIELLNDKAISISYKGTVLLGHKLRLHILPNSWAQQLAFVSLSCGVLEKNGLGCGYCIIDKKR